MGKGRDRTRELNMFRETMQILEQGYYVKDGRKIQLKLSKKEMEEIRVYLPEDVRKYSNQKDFNPPYVIGRCGYGCENRDSYSLARERVTHKYLYDKDIPKILVLNLANPVNPGGGVRRGAKAQEEDLCRCSSLLMSLESKAAEQYYNYNKHLHTYMGSDALMITPKVEIIRDENGELLDETVIVSVVTCAAPMVTYGKEGMSDAEFEQMMFERITGLLKSVAYLGYKNLVLGAWGCGAFGNDAAVISDLFYKALKELDYNGHSQKDLFNRIDFAVLDRTKEQYNFKEFYRNFTHENFYRDEKQQAIDEAMERIRETEVNLDKIRGCLVGGAAGDALGYAIEFINEKEIFSEYGKSGITEYDLDSLTGKAIISDDTQMTLFTANGLLVGDTRGCMRGIQGWPRGYVAMAYKDWLRTQEMPFEKGKTLSRRPMKDSVSWLLDVPELYKRRAPGGTCLSALKYGKPTGDDFILEPINNSKGCGGVMRVAPLALDYKDWDMETLDREGAEIAAITHGHSLGYMPAAVLVHIINRIIFHKESMSLKDIVIEAKASAESIFKGDKHLRELTDLIDLAVELSDNNMRDLDNIHRLGEGWVAEETLAISIYCALRYQDDFSAGIIAAVNHKGDSDSTGAVTGNILGALLGYDAIDDKWKKDLELHDVIIEMADDLCHGCQMSEYSDYEDPDWFRKYIGMKWKDEPQDNGEDMTVEELIQSPEFYEINKILRNGGIF
ncbi:MAG: TIGR02452 family protein [Oscillospiraceae bacterium]|nr:TIGR02452 family protein [Oscillospiraceae bacterium]